MTKDEAIRHLHRFAHAAIFGQAAWPSGRDLNLEIRRMLLASGLSRCIEDQPDTFTAPPPEIDLLLFCIGFNEPMEAPYELECAGLITEEEAEKVWETTSEAGGLALIKLLLMRAYFKRFIQSSARN
jgi:hypothetical protein